MGRAQSSPNALLRSARSLLTALLFCSCFASVAQAQDDEPDTRVGYATDAMPGFGQIAVPRVDPWRIAIGGTASYGYTEDVLAAEDSHHRLAGRLAGAFKIIPNLTLSLRFDGRYDSHTIGDESDDGLVGDPRIGLRFAAESSGLLFGAQLLAWLPGEDAPSIVFDAISVDAKALLGYTTGDFTIATNLGFRLDQSDGSAEGANRLSAADRLSLGVSSSNALLLGLGVGYRLGSAEIFGEWSWDFLIGSDAPDAGQSPMRAGLGGRIWMLDQNALQLELGLDIGLSSRPDPDLLNTGTVLIPIEPRFGVHAGLVFRFPAPERPQTEDVEPEGCQLTSCPEGQELNAEACRCDTVAPPAPTTGTVDGNVTDEQGAPVPNATVAIGAAAATPPADGTAPADAAPPAGVTATTDAAGHFSLANVAPGAAQINATADGYQPATVDVNVVAGQTVTANITLRADLPQGQLRGVIQSFQGRAISGATITVNPLGTQATTDAEGLFQVDVPPGAYQVTISAQGYTEQTRAVTVEERGVTVLNVDMRRAGRGGNK